MLKFLFSNYKAVAGFLVVLVLAGLLCYCYYQKSVITKKDAEISILKVQIAEHEQSINFLKQAQISEKQKTEEVNNILTKCQLSLQQQLADQDEIETILENHEATAKDAKEIMHERICPECIDFINRQFSAIK